MDISVFVWPLVTTALFSFLVLLPFYLLYWVIKAAFKPKDSVTPTEKLNGYLKRLTVMNDSEAAFFNVLLDELPKEYHVFPKMRIADMLQVLDGRGYYQRLNYILPKHVDFLICNRNLEPLLAIELDGSSHNKPSRLERDYGVEAIFASAELELYRVEVGSKFKAIVPEIVERLKA